MKKIQVLAVSLLVLCNLQLVNAATPQGLIIAEIQIESINNQTKEDYIKIYNYSSERVNLKGVRLVKRSKTARTDTTIKSWTNDTWVEPGQFYTWANSSCTCSGQTPNAKTSATLAENNGIALRAGSTDTGTIITALSWGDTDNGFSKVSSNPSPGQQLLKTSLTDNALVYTIIGVAPAQSKTSTPPTSSTQTQKPSTSKKKTVSRSKSKKTSSLTNTSETEADESESHPASPAFSAIHPEPVSETTGIYDQLIHIAPWVLLSGSALFGIVWSVRKATSSVVEKPRKTA